MKTKNKFFSLILSFVLFLSISSLSFAKVRKISLPPASPTGLTITSVTSSSVSLKWNAVSGASGYKVYMATPYNSNYAQISTTSGTIFNNTSLKPGTSYWYYVSAFNSVGTSAGSTKINAVTQQLNTSKLVLGFTTYYYTGDTSSYNSMQTNSALINQIATDTYTISSIGGISGIVPTGQITYANNNTIKPMAMVSNNFDGNIAKAVLENPVNRQNLINNILSSLKSNNYKGVNIDFEGIYYYDRSYFTTFIKELYSTLHTQGFIVTVCVPAKTSDIPTDSWSGAYDYSSLSSKADSIVIMAYDEHYPGGQPGPIASIGWVNSVANYAINTIPKEKVLLGVGAYGYDWSSNGTKAYGIAGIYNLAATYGATIKWDDVSKCPYFVYTDNNSVIHNVWFENSTSLGYKLDIVNNLNLSGIAIWRLGLENPDYWTTIKTKFNK